MARAGGPPLAAAHAPLSPWDALPYLHEAPLEVVVLAAHAAQIATDDHVKGATIRAGLERCLAALVEPFGEVGSGNSSSRGSVEDLITAAVGGKLSTAQALGRALGEQGERGWLLEVIETVAEASFSPRLILWADAFRMLYRTAPEEHYGLLGELAGAQIGAVINA